MKSKQFAIYAWGTLFFNFIVIAWGAFVRISGSGAGCGRHWPLCNGKIIPLEPRIETMIEYSHRATSGLALISAVILFVWAYRLFPKGHIVRFGAKLSLIFMVTEAILGAGLVLLQLVEDNESVGRIFSMGAHLINTFFLIASIALTAWWASGGLPINWKKDDPLNKFLKLALGAMLIIGVTGAITALGDTLFPVQDIVDKGAKDKEFVETFLRQFRVLHPWLAVVISIYLFFIIIAVKKRKYSPTTQKIASFLLFAFLSQLVIGATNIILMVPAWLQLTHLFFADLVWVSLVLLTASVLAIEETESNRIKHSS